MYEESFRGRSKGKTAEYASCNGIWYGIHNSSDSIASSGRRIVSNELEGSGRKH
jgi:hypothetical protein